MAMNSCHPLARSLKLIVLVLGVFAAAAMLQPVRATDVCGAVCDETWTAAGSPYVVTCDITVAAGCSLTVEAGVRVEFDLSTGITVEGSLDVNGVSGSLVVFTSALSSPEAGYWRGLDLIGGSTSNIEYANIWYGSYGLNVDDDANVTLDNVTSRDNWEGLHIEGTGPPSVMATNCWFLANTSCGVHVIAETTGLDINISQSEIWGNTEYAMKAEAAGELDAHGEVIYARENDWGWTSSSSIALEIWDNKHDNYRRAPKVDWCHYLAGGGTPRAVHCPPLQIDAGETGVMDLTDRAWLLTSVMNVEPGGTLQIDPGVDVLIPGNEHEPITIYSRGDLEINGTPGSPVLFTTENNPGDRPWWSGLRIKGDESAAAIDHAIFENGYHGIEVSDHATAILNGVTSRFNGSGLHAFGQSEVTATNCTFTHNTNEGIVVDTYSPVASLTITNSEIHSNDGDYDFYVDTSSPADARRTRNAQNNWWGTTDPFLIRERIIDHVDEDNRAWVDWCEWLDGPGGSPVRAMHCPDPDVCDESRTWDQTDKPYVLTSDVFVCPTGTLTVGSGVEVRTMDDVISLGIDVEGTMDVNGTPGSPVTFTSDASTPGYGDWRGLYFSEAANATINDASITYAYYAIDVRGGATVALDGVSATSNNYGLNVNGNGPPTVTASNCEFTGNQIYGVEIHAPNPNATVTNSSIHSNLGAYDYYTTGSFTNPSQTILNARSNYWGTTDTAAIASRVLDHADLSTLAKVDWCGYLDGGGTAQTYCPDLYICDEFESWSLTDKPYLVTSDLTVCPTGTLTVGSGVEARVVPVDSLLSVNVEGILDVNGTSGSPVMFTSSADTPAAGDWSGVWLRSGSTGTIDHAEIRYAYDGIRTDGGTMTTLTGVTSRDNNDGLSIHGEATLSAADCSFLSNDRYGVYVAGDGGPDPAVTINNSEIRANGPVYDVYLGFGFSTPAETILHFQDNYWGWGITGSIASRIYDRRDNAANALVDWCPYLTSSGGPSASVNCVDLYICDETEVLDLTNEPYLVVSDLHVCPTGTLQIEQGVELRMVTDTSPLKFTVEGVLDVNGTEGAPVTFTSDADTPAVADWSGVKLDGSSTSDIEHASITYGDLGIRMLDAAQATLTGVTAQDNQYGLYVNGTGPPSATASGCTFTGNQTYGVYLNGNPNPDFSITGSSIHSNLGAYDLATGNYSDSGTTVLDARGNYWGSIVTADISSRIYDRVDGTYGPRVDWCGYLDGHEGSAVKDMHCPELVACGGTVVMDLTDKPYQLVSSIYVCPTGTLQVEPGVETRAVVASPKTDIWVEGVLDVNGTEGAPVTFTSDADIPAVADWSGIKLTASSTSDIEHASITYGDRGIRMLDAAQATLTGVTAQDNQYGLYVNGTGPPSATASGCTFTGNQTYGVYLNGNPNPDFSITGSSIHSNLGAYDLATGNYSNSGTTVLDARGNYWGSIVTADISSRIYDRVDGTYGPRVDWCGYLDGHEGSAVKDMHCPELVACDGTAIMNLTDKPYQLVSPMYVCPTGTLQVESGVETRAVVASPRTEIWVDGVLDVNGTEGAPVTFTSDADTPAVADWSGIKLTASSTSDIEHAFITYGDRGIRMLDAAQATLTGVTAQDNQYGLYVNGTGPPNATASGCTFTGNQTYGVYLNGNPNPDFSITGSSIHSNLGAYDLATQTYTDATTTIVWATDNWWGTTDETTIGDRIYDNDDIGTSPHVYFRAFGEECDWALGTDRDGDGLADFQDNCPKTSNASQADIDGDLMGDACDPEPSTTPSYTCDGFEDLLDGYLDNDGDGWGDPCDHRPLRDDSHPGAPELCDGRDNDGDGLLDGTETADVDLDEGLACGDCDDLVAAVHVCACELCDNLVDDDCDLATDGDDADCVLHGNCIVLASGAEPYLTMERDACGGAAVSGPFDVIRGDVEQLRIVGTQVDLGQVECVEGSLTWDRVSDWSTNPNPRCMDPLARYYLSKNSADPDYGAASGGERRDIMDPNPACP